MIETGDDLKRARHALGMSVNDLRRALQLGDSANTYVMRMESGRVPVSGPVKVAVSLLMEREGLRI